MVVGFSDPDVARQAEAARLVDFVINFDPLTTEACAVSLAATETGCGPHQAVESARLSGGNPALARAILRAWMRHNFSPATASDRDNMRRLQEALAGVADGDRTARFRCVMAVVAPDGRTWTSDGVCEGRILREPRGESGFGYDPLFVPAGYESTFAELDARTKNRISHRAMALRRIADILGDFKDIPG